MASSSLFSSPSSRPSGATPCNPRAILTSPAFLAAVIVLAVNDHGLKGAGLLPAVVTGKLSDFAGLFFAPTLFALVVGARSRRALLACDALTAIVFAAVKLTHAGNAIYDALMPGRAIMDATDCIALPMIVVARRLWPAITSASASASAAAPVSTERASRSTRWLSPAIALLAIFACAGTSASPARLPQVPEATWVERGTPRLSLVKGLASVVVHYALPIYAVDCTMLARDPRRTLDHAKLEPAIGGFINGDIPLDRDGFAGFPGGNGGSHGCGAAMIVASESTVFGIGSDKLYPIYVVWRRDAVRAARKADPPNGGRVFIVSGDGALDLRTNTPGIRVFPHANVPIALPEMLPDADEAARVDEAPSSMPVATPPTSL